MIVNDMSSLARSVEQYDISSDDDTSGKRVTVSPLGSSPLAPFHEAPLFLFWHSSVYEYKRDWSIAYSTS